MKKLYFLLLTIFPFLGKAQGMQETFMEGDKINVVYVVILIILLGLIAYLAYIDIKVNKVEKRIKDIEK